MKLVCSKLKLDLKLIETKMFIFESDNLKHDLKWNLKKFETFLKLNDHESNINEK